MPEDVHVRSAKVFDIAPIQSVARESWAAAYDGIIPEAVQKEALERWYRSDALRESIESKDSIFLVAEREGVIAGFAHFTMDQDVADLGRIYVMPGDQRRGIGRHLMTSGLQQLQLRGVRSLSVRVEQQNAQARRFYESGGFRYVTESIASLFGYPLAIVVYERPVG